MFGSPFSFLVFILPVGISHGIDHMKSSATPAKFSENNLDRESSGRTGDSSLMDNKHSCLARRSGGWGVEWVEGDHQRPISVLSKQTGSKRTTHLTTPLFLPVSIIVM